LCRFSEWNQNPRRRFRVGVTTEIFSAIAEVLWTASEVLATDGMKSCAGDNMRRHLKLDNEGGPTLKDINLPTIEVECVPCQHRDVLERKAIVRKLGVDVSLSRLRRRLAMGCDRFFHVEGDRCGMRFPCLDRIAHTTEESA
jgi:hypothetical protein